MNIHTFCNSFSDENAFYDVNIFILPSRNTLSIKYVNFKLHAQKEKWQLRRICKSFYVTLCVSWDLNSLCFFPINTDFLRDLFESIIHNIYWPWMHSRMTGVLAIAFIARSCNRFLNAVIYFTFTKLLTVFANR